MNAPAIRQKQELSQTVVTRIVTETLPDNPDPATLLERMRRKGDTNVIRIAVMTQDQSGALSGAAVQEFDSNGVDLGRRSADVVPGTNGPVIDLKLAGASIARLTFETADAHHLAPQMASLWTNGILTG